MTDLGTAQERLEAAIGQLEKALDKRARQDRAMAKEGESLRATNEAISQRLDSAIERLQSLLGNAANG